LANSASGQKSAGVRRRPRGLGEKHAVKTKRKESGLSGIGQFLHPSKKSSYGGEPDHQGIQRLGRGGPISLD